MPDKPPVLAPCPFCGGEAHFERTGTPRQSCIVACTECGARLETGETWEHSGKAWNRRAECHRDSVDGADRKPEGRETIDAMRDMALAAAEGLGATDPDRVRRLADLLFAYHCDATALKYRQRTGKKGPAADDVRKAEWYEAMALHVRGQGPDPRHKRPGFEPYAYPVRVSPFAPWVRVYWSSNYLDFERPAPDERRWSVSVSRYGSFRASLALMSAEGGGPVIETADLGPNDTWTDDALGAAARVWADDVIERHPR